MRKKEDIPAYILNIIILGLFICTSIFFVYTGVKVSWTKVPIMYIDEAAISGLLWFEIYMCKEFKVRFPL
jgi:hypothetical protein